MPAPAAQESREVPRVPWRPGAWHAVGVWVAVRTGLMCFMLLAAYVLGLDRSARLTDSVAWALARFTWSDSFHFLRIADKGYLPPGLPCCDQAFFPGYPLAMRAVMPLTAGSSVAAGVVVSALAGVAAAVLLWRLAARATGSAPGGLRAVVYLAVAPYGVFLAAVYGESLFLAFTLGAWLAGQTRHWWLAGVLAALATGVRVNGLFVAAGLMVMYAVQMRADRRRLPRPDALALLAPGVAVLAYLGWLHHLTGSWRAWQEAETLGWHRRSAWPWQGLAAGWHTAVTAHTPVMVVSRTADLVAACLGIALVVTLLVLRQWPEATYVGLGVAVLVCSTTVQSSPRYALMWFPGYILAAQVTDHERLRWLHTAILLVCVPLLAVVSLTFASHQWVA